MWSRRSVNVVYEPVRLLSVTILHSVSAALGWFVYVQLPRAAVGAVRRLTHAVGAHRLSSSSPSDSMSDLCCRTSSEFSNAFIRALNRSCSSWIRRCLPQRSPHTDVTTLVNVTDQTPPYEHCARVLYKTSRFRSYLQRLHALLLQIFPLLHHRQDAFVQAAEVCQLVGGGAPVRRRA